MGIQNLLPLLTPITTACNISQFKGKTVAVDTYCWLHKGVMTCVEDLVFGRDADGYVKYCMKMVSLLRLHNIKPIMVFDGRRLPAKQMTEEKRRSERKVAKKEGAELLRLGKKEEARSKFMQSVDITAEMALKVIKACQAIGVDCIVAPYEADAQLGFFSRRNIVDLVISEDSDLLLFGCTKVLYKMDAHGFGRLVDTTNLNSALNFKADPAEIPEKFRHMCILSGCDYIGSLPGIGLKKALKFVKLTAQTDPNKFLDKIPAYLNMRHLVVDAGYKLKFCIADATFKHQVVYDPFRRQLTHLTDIAEAKTNLAYCVNAGEMFDENVAYQLALGNLNPATLHVLSDFKPDPNKTGSIWHHQGWNRQMSTKSDTVHVRPNACHTATSESAVVKGAFDDQLQSELQQYIKQPADKDVTAPMVESPVEEKMIMTLSTDVTSYNPFIKRRCDIPETLTITTSRFFAQKECEETTLVKTDQTTVEETVIEQEEQDENGYYGSENEMCPMDYCETVQEMSPSPTLACVENLMEPIGTDVTVPPNKKRKLQQTTILSMFKKLKK